MTAPAHCPSCQHELPVNALMGLCPLCLLSQGMDHDTLSLSHRDGAGVTARWGEDVSHVSVLELLESVVDDVPSILLRDTAAERELPVVRPSSSEMPADKGRYQLLGEIGHGGMGAVFKGRDPDLGRDLAVKILLEEHQSAPDLVRRFIEEAQIGGQLQHPGIVPVYELGSFDDRRPYFTMKLVKGRTLAALLKDRVSPAHDLPRFLGVFEQVCQTMAYAHARGVIHRDLKPSNVMVGTFGEVQVMDWGLTKVLPKDGPKKDVAARPAGETIVAPVRARSSGRLSQAGSVLGTPSYMAPEQARGEIEAIDRRADVFALGSILCEILTGLPAFDGDEPNEIVRAARRADTAAALVRLERCGAEPELLALARDCLAARADDRPDDAGVVAARVTGYLAGVQDRLREAELSRAAESARAQEAEAKAYAERRARRLTAALAATVVFAGLLVGAGWRWIELDRLKRVRDASIRINGALQGAIRLRALAQGAIVGDLAPWERAVGAAEKARDLLDDGIDPALRNQVEALAADVAVEQRQAAAAARAADRDRQLMDRLVDIRSAEADDRGGWTTDAAYADAFGEAGLDVAALSAAEAAQRIRDRPPEVATTLSAALDDWAAIRRDRQKNRAAAATLTALADAAARLVALRGLAKATPLDAPISLDLLGRALKDAGDPIEAESVLRQAQQRHPRDVWINYDLARSLEKLARGEEAIRYYTAARSLRPETAHELAHALGYKGERAEEIAIFEDLRRLRPGSGRHLGCLGRALKEQGRSQEASAILESAATANREAIRKKPDDAYAHFSLGFALLMQGKPDEAIAEYKSAIRIQPDDATFHDNLCAALGAQGKLDEAIAEHRTAIRIQPDFANAHNTLGHILSDFKLDHRAAADEFRAAVRLQPDSALYHNNLGVALQKLDELDEAIAEYRITAQLQPKFADPHMGLGEIFEFQGKRDEAIAAFSSASRLEPDSADAHYHVAWAMLKKPDCSAHERTEALEHARRAVALAPKDASFLTALALAEYRAGHWAESIAAAEQSIAGTKGVDASNWFLLAMALRRKGENDTARKWFDKAVTWTRETDPKNPELTQFWVEAANLLSEPAPHTRDGALPAATLPAKPR